MLRTLALIACLALMPDPAAGAEGVQARFRSAQKLLEVGDVAGARRELEGLLPELRRSADRPGLGRALNALSLIYSDAGQYSEALRSAREAVSIRRALGDRPGEARSANNAGVALLNLGDYPAALSEFEGALALHRELGEKEDEVIALNNIGNVCFYQGRYVAALGYYRMAMAVVDRTVGEDWTPHERFRTAANTAALYQKIGRYDLALNLYAGLRATEGVLSPSEQARVLSNLGALYRRLGDPVKAMETYRGAQELYRVQRHVDGEIGTLKNVGIVQGLDLGRMDEALGSFREALRVAERTSNLREAVQTRIYAGEVFRRVGRTAEAGVELQRALEDARRLGGVEEQWKALYGIGRIAADGGDIPGARGALSDAVGLIESVRSRTRLATFRSDFLADKRDVYDALIAVLLRARRAGAGVPSPGLEEIHRAIEDSRARNFRDQLTESLESLQGRGDPSLVRRLRELRAQMSVVWSRQAGGPEAGGAEAGGGGSRELAALEQRYLDIERRLAAGSPAGNPAGVSKLADIQQSLDASTLLVEYWVGAGSLAAVWARRGAAGIVERVVSARDLEQVADCAAAIGDGPAAGWSAPCAGASAAFLGVIEPLLDDGVRELVVVPDEHLAFLPFEILTLPRARSLLVERCGVSYLPSASLHTRREPGGLGRRMPWSRTLAAFGDVRPEAGGGSLQDAWSEPLPAPLAHSREEVESIARFVGGRQQLRLGAQARKSEFLGAAAAGFRLVHVSSHATIDPENPQRSRLLLAPDPGSFGPGYLFLGELFNVDLRAAELVTFSACDTARGRTVRGEGVQDFSRALLVNGARATLTALWRVADRPTAEFMRQFYYLLAEGLPKGEALRQAKLVFLHSGNELSHPYYWAAFVMNGDASTSFDRPLSWPSALLISVGFLCGGTGLILLCHRLARRRGLSARRTAGQSSGS